MNRRSCSPRVTAALFLMILATQSASACTVCFNATQGKSLATALNGMIFVMLGFVLCIWIALGFFIYTLVRRSKAPTPEHVRVAEMMKRLPNES